MDATRPKKWTCFGITFCVAVCVTNLFGCNDRPVPKANACSSSRELTRVTSPNRQLDAVLVECMYGGAAGGGVDSNVYIVRKGAPVYVEPNKEIFNADPMTGGELVWRRDHLLEIHYDIAYIHRFRNVWGLYEIENVGSTGDRDYEVELRLVPASDSSALTSDGSFRHVGDH
jgi:hypothetical protein